MKARLAVLGAAVLLACIGIVGAADFGTRGGSAPANVDAIAALLHRDAYAMELLISFGTSKGGSAGHLALALRNGGPGDDLVYSANFYADRSPKHEQGFYTTDLMVAVPKLEYLFGTSSTLGPTASFGLDFGEIYKRSVVGIRVYGVLAAERDALAAYFARINADYHARAADTEYHRGEVRYDYLHLNCAKTIGSAFKYGAGYRDLEIAASTLSPRRKIASALNANVPTEMAMKLVEAWAARGHAMDVVLYRKYRGSPYVDPHDDNPIAFRDLPDRFPSVLSRDFGSDGAEYRDFDNLYAMYLLRNLRKYSIRIDDATGSLELSTDDGPMPYAQAAERAMQDAATDSRGLLGRAPFPRSGRPLVGDNDDAAVHR